MSPIRCLFVILAFIAATLLAELFLANDGYRKTLKLRAAVGEQQALNEELRVRNRALDAEVLNLKDGREAAEERARTDLGMIGSDETFYQVVSRPDATRE